MAIMYRNRSLICVCVCNPLTFEIIRAVTMKITVPYDVMPCILVKFMNISEDPSDFYS
jgi:hypothetical protein